MSDPSWFIQCWLIQSALSDAELPGCSRVSGNHDMLSMVFIKLIQIQFLGQFLAYDHFTQLTESTAASHHLCQARKSLRASQEWLLHRFLVTVYHNMLPGLLQTFCCKKSSVACEAGPASQQSRVFWAMQLQLCGGCGDHGFTKAVHTCASHQINAVPDLALLGRAQLRKNCTLL